MPPKRQRKKESVYGGQTIAKSAIKHIYDMGRLKTTEIDLVKIESAYLLPAKIIGKWMALVIDQRFPSLNIGEITLFTSFFEHGLGLLTSKFSRGLLHFYGINLPHLNNSSINHLSIFAHLCEALCGLPTPTWRLLP